MGFFGSLLGGLFILLGGGTNYSDYNLGESVFLEGFLKSFFYLFFPLFAHTRAGCARVEHLILFEGF